MIRRFARLAVVPSLVVAVAIGCSNDAQRSAPEDTAQTEEALTSFAAGSLVIPMDTDFQNAGTLQAFGLVYKLLTSNVPVSWVVQTGKAQGGVDFVASGKDLKSGATVTSHGYRGGPFVMDSANRAAALPIIQAWQGANTTAVHDMTSSFSGVVQRALVAAPKIAVFVDGSEDIAFGYLNAAGIPDSLGNPWPKNKLASYAGHPDVLTEAQVAGPTTGGAFDGVLLNSDGTPAWCQLTSMHYNSPGNAESIREVRGWLSASPNTHAYMECEATQTFENSVNGHFLTTAGISKNGKSPNPVGNLHPDSPFAQYDGPFNTVGGSVDVINLSSGSSLYSSDVTLLNLSGDPPTSNMAWMTGHVDGSPTKGKVSYLVGHQYTTNEPITGHATTNGTRLFLDSLFETDCASASSQPTITLTKSAPSTISGNSITYTLSYGNSGPGIASAVSLVDPIPTGSTFVSATNGGAFANGSVTWSLGNLSVNETGSVSFTVSVSANGTYTNQATIDYDVGVTPKSQTSNTTSTVRGGAGSSDLSVTMGDSPDPVAPGGAITYAVGVSNAGPDTSGSVTVTDAIPAGSTFVSASGNGWSCSVSAGVVTCTHAGLASGASAPLSIAIDAPSNIGTVTNTVSVSSPTPDPGAGNNTATTTTTVQASADLSITMSGAPNPVAAGGALTYSATVKNAGPSTSSAITLTDTLPAGVTFVSATGGGWSCSATGQTLTCTHAGLAPAATAPLTIDVTAPSTPGKITNAATVASSTSDPSNANNTASVDTTVGLASSDVSVTMTGAPNPVVEGGTIAYSVNVANAGPSPSGTVTVTDTLPAGVTFVSGTGNGWTCNAVAQVVTCTHAPMAAGSSAPLAIDVTAPSTPGTVTNTVVVAGVSADPSLGNNSATVSTTVNPPPGSDMSITVSGTPDPVGTGGDETYAIGVANAGPSTSGVVTVKDTLPAGATLASASGAGWTCSSAAGVVTCTHAALASGASAPLTIDVTAPALPGVMTNVATVSTTTPDPDGSNDTVITTTAVTIANAADLSLAVNGTPDPVAGGGAETYAMTVANGGPNGSGPLTLTDTLPTGATFQSATGTGWTCNATATTVTCTHAALGNGANATLSLVVTAPAASGTMTNTATVTSTSVDPDDTNNTVVSTTTVNGGGGGGDAGSDAGGGSDLSVSVSATPDPVAPGGTETYTVTATNSGPDASGAVTVTITLPPGATFQGSSGGGWTCNASGTTVTCTHGPLQDGASDQVQVQVQVPGTPGTITTTTTIASTDPDPNGSNNTVQTSTTVAGASDAGACNSDSDCGGPTSGVVCDGSTGTCVAGCRGQGGNGCPAGTTCTSTDTGIGQCVASDGGASDGGASDGAASDDGGGDGAVSDDGGGDGAASDAGESDAGGADSGATDGGAGDAGAGSDGGALADAGANGDGGAASATDDGSFGGGGCNCTTAGGEHGGGSGAPALACLVAIGVVASRRRSRDRAESR